MIPMLGGVFLLVVVMLGVQMLIGRKKPLTQLPSGAPRSYGAAGGAICRRCQRPFALHWWAVNLGLSAKFDRYDYCGKWGVVRRASLGELRAAEQAENAAATPQPLARAKTDEDHLKDLLDNSRYTDGL
jgi:hypothetical protein